MHLPKLKLIMTSKKRLTIIISVTILTVVSAVAYLLSSRENGNNVSDSSRSADKDVPSLCETTSAENISKAMGRTYKLYESPEDKPAPEYEATEATGPAPELTPPEGYDRGTTPKQESKFESDNYKNSKNPNVSENSTGLCVYRSEKGNAEVFVSRLNFDSAELAKKKLDEDQGVKRESLDIKDGGKARVVKDFSGVERYELSVLVGRDIFTVSLPKEDKDKAEKLINEII